MSMCWNVGGVVSGRFGSTLKIWITNMSDVEFDKLSLTRGLWVWVRGSSLSEQKFVGTTSGARVNTCFSNTQTPLMRATKLPNSMHKCMCDHPTEPRETSRHTLVTFRVFFFFDRHDRNKKRTVFLTQSHFNFCNTNIPLRHPPFSPTSLSSLLRRLFLLFLPFSSFHVIRDYFTNYVLLFEHP